MGGEYHALNTYTEDFKRGVLRGISAVDDIFTPIQDGEITTKIIKEWRECYGEDGMLGYEPAQK